MAKSSFVRSQFARESGHRGYRAIATEAKEKVILGTKLMPATVAEVTLELEEEMGLVEPEKVRVVPAVELVRLAEALRKR